MNLLFATSELFPLLKTGGLGDVAQSLPNALAGSGVDVRVVLPAFRQAMREVQTCGVLGWVTLGDGREVRYSKRHMRSSPFPCGW
jgi:starch synthase